MGTVKSLKKGLKGVNKFVPQKIYLKGLTNSLNKKIDIVKQVQQKKSVH